ncbi:MAG: putative permease [Clostridia bacterium]|nr:putative permease [Clostridia bacterium]
MDLEWLALSLGIMLQSAGSTFLQLFPYAAVGALLGEILKFTSWTKLIYKGINASKHLSIFAAAILGILSPLCTYGTIPVVITLYRGGVSMGPLISFLSASSLMNPQLFIMTWGGLNSEFALIRLLIVFLFAIICGYITILIPEKWVVLKNRLLNEQDKEAIENRPIKAFSFKALSLNSLKSLLFVGKYMVIGILAGAAIETFVPKTLIMNTLGGNTVMSILIAALIGIPLYACGGGIIPTVRAMISSGMSDGAAMAFLTVGQGTRLTSVFALAAVFRPVFIIGYCIFLVLFSTLTGLLF